MAVALLTSTNTSAQKKRFEGEIIYSTSVLDATYFEKVSGGEFYNGYLIREIK